MKIPDEKEIAVIRRRFGELLPFWAEIESFDLDVSLMARTKLFWGDWEAQDKVYRAEMALMREFPSVRFGFSLKGEL